MIDTVSGFENVTGSAGADYIVGDSGANNITTGAGATTLFLDWVTIPLL